MTTSQRTHGSIHKGKPRTDADQRAIHRALASTDDHCLTIADLVAQLQAPREYLQQLVQEMEADGIVSIQQGFAAVDVSLNADECRVRTDGAGELDEDATSASESSIPETLTDLRPDVAFEMMQSRRRRIMLIALAEFLEDVTVDPVADAVPPEPAHYVALRDLAAAVEARRLDVSMEELTADDRHRGYVSVTQAHATRLDEHDLVQYDEQTKKVAPAPAVIDLAESIDEIRKRCGWTPTHPAPAIEADG